MQVNSYSNEIRYTLSLMAYHLNLTQPSSVRIASHSIEMVEAVVRNLCYGPMPIFVETEEIQTRISDSLGRLVHVSESGKKIADAALFPFSLEDGLHPTGERIIIAACHNALSYKSLQHPLSAQGTIFEKLRRLRPNYHLDPVAGLFSPRFIFWLSLAKLVEHWDSALYFRLEDRAMRQLIELGPMWRLSYIVVVTGRTSS